MALIAKSLPTTSLVPPSYRTASKVFFLQDTPSCKMLLFFWTIWEDCNLFPRFIIISHDYRRLFFCTLSGWWLFSLSHKIDMWCLSYLDLPFLICLLLRMLASAMSSLECHHWYLFLGWVPLYILLGCAPWCHLPTLLAQWIFPHSPLVHINQGWQCDLFMSQELSDYYVPTALEHTCFLGIDFIG